MILRNPKQDEYMCSFVLTQHIDQQHLYCNSHHKKYSFLKEDRVGKYIFIQYIISYQMYKLSNAVGIMIKIQFLFIVNVYSFNKILIYPLAVGGSTNVCSDVYSGSQAFSEKESQAVETFIMNNRQNMMAYLTYHSYGQMWLYPWGFTSSLPSDWQELVSSQFIQQCFKTRGFRISRGVGGGGVNYCYYSLFLFTNK